MDILKFRKDMGQEKNGEHRLALIIIELLFYTFKNSIICGMGNGRGGENCF